MLMKNITDPQSFVETLPVGYSSGNPNARPPMKMYPANFCLVSLTLITIFFVLFGFFFA